MKQSLLTNIKYLALGLVLAGALGLVHADFPMPTAVAPASNIDVPLHTGPDQVKNGGLSVNTFLANQNAQFKQQTFLNGTVFGGTPGLASSTIAIGDSATPANVAVNGNVSASQYIQSTSVANSSSSNLCANSNGTIVTCTVGATNNPTITFVGTPNNNGNGTTTTMLSIGPSVQPGNVFRIVIYYYAVYVTAVAGDNAESIAQKMIAAINNTTMSQWQSVNVNAPYPGWTPPPGDPNAAPANRINGFPPTATSLARNASWLAITIDSGHVIQGADASPS